MCCNIILLTWRTRVLMRLSSRPWEGLSIKLSWSLNWSRYFWWLVVANVTCNLILIVCYYNLCAEEDCSSPSEYDHWIYWYYWYVGAIGGRPTSVSGFFFLVFRVVLYLRVSSMILKPNNYIPPQAWDNKACLYDHYNSFKEGAGHIFCRVCILHSF